MNAATGEARKSDVLSTLEANRETLILQARRRFLLHLLENGTGTADDARRGLDLRGLNPVALGAVPGPLARAHIIRRMGYTKSAHREAHVRHVTVWQLLDRGRALAWLAAHPEPPALDIGQLDFFQNEEPGRGNAPANNGDPHHGQRQETF
jgi:hypothetical protein